MPKHSTEPHSKDAAGQYSLSQSESSVLLHSQPAQLVERQQTLYFLQGH